MGVVETAGTRLLSIEFTVIKTPAGRPHSECLAKLDQELKKIIERTHPDGAAIEGIFFCKNVKTAVILGEARGVVIAACATAHIPIYEYSPRRMKQALVGFGGADKEQVGKMVVTLLGLREKPPLDAADALALAICHLHTHTRHSLLNADAL